MARKILFLLIFVIQASLCCFSQIAEEGIPFSFENELSAEISTVKMPSFDLQKAVEEFNGCSKCENQKMKYGNTFEVNLNLDNSGNWETLSSGDRVWRLKIYSAGAMSLNLSYDDFYLPNGGKLFLYNEDHSQVLGAFTDVNNKSYRKFSTGLIEGEKLSLEYYEPFEVVGQSTISISTVTHSIKDFFKKYKGFGDSGPCNNNMNCVEGDPYQDVKRSVAMILNGNAGLCTGTLINNTNNDGRPYFLTSLHCLDKDFDGFLTESELEKLETWIFMFNYESPSCENINGPLNQTISGSKLIAYFPESDFLLLELSCAPPVEYDVYFAGWNRAEEVDSNQVVIHHPSGDIKKLTFNKVGAPIGEDFYELEKDTHWFVSEWEDGTTEGGSSGCGIFDINGYYIGNLSGGDASCSSPTEGDSFGKFTHAWETGVNKIQKLQPWLDPNGLGTIVLDGINAPASDLDASITLLNVEDGKDVCYETFNPIIEINNLGTDSITNFDVSIFLDGEEVESLNFNKTIRTCNDILIEDFSEINTDLGSHTIEARLNTVNGKVDQNLQNNKNSSTVKVVPGELVSVEVLTDDFPIETSFEILDENDEQLYFVFGLGKAVLSTYDFCLPASCYKFVIRDKYGDGICCGSFGDGSYTVIKEDGTILGTGGEFLETDTVSFCLENVLSPDFSSDQERGCDSIEVEFSNISLGEPILFLWQFPEGNPSTSTQKNPVIKYEKAGVYDVQLSASDGAKTLTIRKEDYINIFDSPKIEGSIINVDENVVGSIELTFEEDNSSYEYLWSNGETSQNIENLEPGLYNVTVTDAATTCTAYREFEVEDLGSGILHANTFDYSIFPNPASDKIEINHLNGGFHELEIYTIDGRLIQEASFYGKEYLLNLSSEIKTGIYFVIIDKLGNDRALKLTVVN